MKKEMDQVRFGVSRTSPSLAVVIKNNVCSLKKVLLVRRDNGAEVGKRNEAEASFRLKLGISIWYCSTFVCI